MNDILKIAPVLLVCLCA